MPLHNGSINKRRLISVTSLVHVSLEERAAAFVRQTSFPGLKSRGTADPRLDTVDFSIRLVSC